MIALGSLLASAAGVFVVIGWKNRTGPDAAQPPIQPPRATPSPVTTIVIGLALAGCAYHLFAYALPPAWFPLIVPPSRWWLVPTIAAGAVGGSFFADRLDRR